MMTEFETYLTTKKIDPKAFASRKKEVFDEFESLFMQMHPESFTAQKLFLINSIRREFPLKEEATSTKKPVKTKMKPKIAPRIKK